MLRPSKTIWSLEPHTLAKHLILRRYLHAWLPIISSRNQKVLFLDGFAGPGIYAGGEEGSPVIAMKALIEHAHRHVIKAKVMFLFIEANKKRSETLASVIEPLKAQLPEGSSASVVHGEYAPLLSQTLEDLATAGKQLAPSLVFIDPFGVKGLTMDLVRRVLATRSCEVLLNFMVGYAHRFIAAPEFEKPLDAIFGTPRWQEGRDLAGHARVDFLRRLYIEELSRTDVCGRAEYARAFSMLDESQRPIYDLVFATNHPQGIDKMKDALWKVDGSGGERFSDATDPGQATLLDDSVEHDQGLLALLRDAFAGQTVTWPQTEEFIRRSPYRILKRPLLKAAKDPASGIRIQSDTRGLTALSRITFI
ncbi:three-Cys-motif partner protein TcmP [Marilutibacter alkalisoli]|uniref:Three-Cys-motif partner protein TcmP n=1 Tax=Marilutibacter alkalisoli TaxID=2591633 RepID=A0A514BQG8_9GAMM|nr:three-Cys-motif partner protein TcmP [Lysobacter alkalisoli]QDH69643.1 three-Cys-motif partner protein TcmP [Lysobacter alkalisoli]